MKKNIFLFSICLTMAFLGYKTSIATKEQYRAVKSINYSLQTEEGKSDVLLAEWTYLNRYERLEQLADKHLPNLTSVKPMQVASLSNGPAAVNFASMGLPYEVAALSDSNRKSEKI